MAVDSAVQHCLTQARPSAEAARPLTHEGGHDFLGPFRHRCYIACDVLLSELFGDPFESEIDRLAVHHQFDLIGFAVEEELHFVGGVVSQFLVVIEQPRLNAIRLP